MVKAGVPSPSLPGTHLGNFVLSLQRWLPQVDSFYFPKEEFFHQGTDTGVPLKYQLQLPPEYLGQELACREVIDPDLREVRLLSHNGDKEECLVPK